MSMSEILEEASKLSVEERHILVQKLNELDLEAHFDETPEFLASLDEAASEPRENCLTVEQVRENVKRWARSE